MDHSIDKNNIIDFKVMGFDSITSDFLNWCMKNRDNLEWIKQKEIMQLKSGSSILHFDSVSVIRRIDRNFTDSR